MSQIKKLGLARPTRALTALSKHQDSRDFVAQCPPRGTFHAWSMIGQMNGDQSVFLSRARRSGARPRRSDFRIAGKSHALIFLILEFFVFFVSFVSFSGNSMRSLTEFQGLSCPVLTNLEQKETKETKGESPA
jgi:hypothetical protein